MTLNTVIIHTIMSMFKINKPFVRKYKELNPFPNKLGEFVYMRTYSRIMSNGKKEQWYNTVERVVNGTFNIQKKWMETHGITWNEHEMQKQAREMYDMIFNMKFLPAGRGLWAMGTPITEERKLYSALNNCFSGDTKFFADGTLLKLQDVGDNKIQVLCKDNMWREATVKNFGEQQLYKITFESFENYYNFETSLEATSDHRWLLSDGTETTNLKVGDKIKITPHPQVDGEEYERGLIHGIVFDEGSQDEKCSNRFSFKTSNMEHTDILKKYFLMESFTVNKQSPERLITFIHEGVNLKELPSNQCSSKYKYGFIDGWLKNKNDRMYLDLELDKECSWLISHAGLLGYCIAGYKKDSKHQLIISFDSVEYKVKSIEESRKEDVYCVVEPETRSFTLESGIPTGNCAFISTDNLDKDLSKPFCFLMDLSMTGVNKLAHKNTVQ